MKYHLFRYTLHTTLEYIVCHYVVCVLYSRCSPHETLAVDNLCRDTNSFVYPFLFFIGPNIIVISNDMISFIDLVWCFKFRKCMDMQ